MSYEEGMNISIAESRRRSRKYKFSITLNLLGELQSVKYCSYDMWFFCS